MKTIILLLLLFSFSICLAQKQTIEQAEYFIGNDPGEGKGNALNFVNFGDASLSIPWDSLPPLQFGGHIYLRVKSSGFTDNNGKQISGVWSEPMLVKYPTTQVLQAAEAKIMRPGLGYPILKNIWATDGKFDFVIEKLQMLISKDSLKVGDTLYIRLQNTLDLWGDWTLIAITPDIFTGIKDNFESKRFKMQVSPNPVQDNLRINFVLNKDSDVSIYLSDILGNKILSFADSNFFPEGAHELLSDIKLPVGVYFCTVKTREISETIKVIVNW